MKLCDLPDLCQALYDLLPKPQTKCVDTEVPKMTTSTRLDMVKQYLYAAACSC